MVGSEQCQVKGAGDLGEKARGEQVSWGQLGQIGWPYWRLCLCSLLLCTPCVSLMPMSPTPSVPSASDRPCPRLLRVCLPHRSLSACDPPAPALPLGLGLDQPPEGSVSVPPHTHRLPQHRFPSSRLRISRRSRALSAQSRSGSCRFAVESRAQSLLPLLLPRLRPHALCRFQPTFRRPSRLQSYSHPSQPRKPR